MCRFGRESQPSIPERELLTIGSARQRGGGLLRDDGVDGLGRMDAVPEQELIGLLAGEGGKFWGHPGAVAVVNPNAIGVATMSLSRRNASSWTMRIPGSTTRSCFTTPSRPPLNAIVSPVASCIAPGLIRSSVRIAGVSPTFGARQTMKVRAPAAYSLPMLFAIAMIAS